MCSILLMVYFYIVMFSICHYRHLLFIFSPTDISLGSRRRVLESSQWRKRTKLLWKRRRKKISSRPFRHWLLDTGLSNSCSPLGYWSTSTAGHAVVWWQWAWERPGGNHSPVKLGERFNPLFFPAHDTRQRTLRWLSNSEREPPLLSIRLMEKLENKVILSSLYG